MRGIRLRMVEWILSLIFLAAPPDAPRGEFREVAEAIDAAINDGLSGDRFEDAAKLVALAARESRFDPYAVGYDQFGESYGLFQVHSSNVGKVVFCEVPSWSCSTVLSASDVFDPIVASQVAIHMIRVSERVCRRRPPEERLGWYASGGRGCDVPEGLAASRNRMALAKWLLRKIPPPVLYTSRSVDVLPRRTK